MRFRTIAPFLLVGVVAITVLVFSARVSHDDTREVAPAASAQAPENLSAARSAAEMVAQDPLHLLVTEQDRVLAERKRFLDALDAAYRAEPVDSAWSQAAERALVDVTESAPLADTGITPDAWSTRCRSESCKITASFADYNDAQDWANFFLTGTGDTLARAELSIQRGADSATHVLIFGARR